MNLRTFFTVGLACAAIASLSAPAIGQMRSEEQLGSKIKRKPKEADPLSEAHFRTALQRCYFARFPDRANAFLAQSDPSTREFPDDTVSFSDFRPQIWAKGCAHYNDPMVLKQQMSLPVPTFRYMMAEEAYLSANRSGPPANLAPALDAKAPGWGVVRRYVSTGDALGKARFMGDFADCLVAKDPVGADALVRTDPNTVAERDAAVAMVPALGQCLVDGHELELNPVNIRSFAADGLWQRYVARPPMFTQNDSE